jgi:redox-sensitive bicupin YhaK (pirin superfamily)
MSDDTILGIESLGFPWQTADPFLFCVHHLDHYPSGNEKLGPDASLAGRRLGMDFEGKDGWRMYHGTEVPGFPQHPHRGFETITVARQGFIDHADSLGATARFGKGDVQWMTAGKGIVHSEAFPLLDRDGENTTELFQIWLNLPREDKLVDPYFTMFWDEEIPREVFTDSSGRSTEVRVIAGTMGELVPPPPPPDSWASRPDSEVQVWSIAMEPGAEWTAPAGAPDVNRHLYFFSGDAMKVAGQTVEKGVRVQVRSDVAVRLENGDSTGEILLLQGRPIGEPVAQRGPFVMNYPGEIRQAMLDFQRTGFGGWPWDDEEPVHPRERGRFAIHADGREERAPANPSG